MTPAAGLALVSQQGCNDSLEALKCLKSVGYCMVVWKDLKAKLRNIVSGSFPVDNVYFDLFNISAALKSLKFFAL